MNAYIAGVGESPLGKTPNLNSIDLQRAAALSALDDAGLTLADVDGLLTTPIRVEKWAMPVGMVARGLGIRPGYMATLDVAGASGTAMVHNAAMAVATGQAEVVLCVAGQNQLTNVSRDATVAQIANVGWAHPEYEAPYGPLIPTLYALVAQRHMHEYGTTAEQMAEVAVAIRGHAVLNPLAQMKTPITIQDVLASKMITSPLHMLDCAIVSDGAAAFVVSSRKGRKRPVKLLGQGYGFTHAYIGEHDNIATTGAVQSGRRAFKMAGVKPADIDIAELYDCFTITVIAELEDLGFCPKGEGGRFVEGGRIRLGGELPVATHGGLLSAVHPGLAGGMFHVVEAVRQLRGECGARQVKDAELVLAHGNGGIIGIHCTLILGQG
ncbi:MAG: thiolase family protein [Betaproteobacteria bacterium]